MEIILLEEVEKLGHVGDFVNVKNGYARNYLIPQNKALRANEENKKYFEERKQEIIKKNDEKKAVAEKLYNKINNKTITLLRHASDEGRLYGAISLLDIANKLSEISQSEVKKSQVVLPKAIRETGIFQIRVRIHASFIADIKVNVARTEEEAKANLKQAKEINDVTKETSAKSKKEDKVVEEKENTKTSEEEAAKK